MWVVVGSIVEVVERKLMEITNQNKHPLEKPTNLPRRKDDVQTDYFERKLDDKRRLTIPAELRAEFASGVVLTRGFGKYLHLYPQQVWDREVEGALTGSILDERVADLNVKFRRGKTALALDQKQGRVTIEQHLLDYADIDREVVAVRAGAYFRLMAAEHAD